MTEEFKYFLHRLAIFFRLKSNYEEWEYGECNGGIARRHKVNGNVQFVLWKAGQQGHKQDYWHNFGGGWKQLFVLKKDLPMKNKIIEQFKIECKKQFAGRYISVTTQGNRHAWELDSNFMGRIRISYNNGDPDIILFPTMRFAQENNIVKCPTFKLKIEEYYDLEKAYNSDIHMTKKDRRYIKELTKDFE